tara:strand:- start:333 stop:1100 length:768 start_codon:yes stop_codon:yes gene_type:complete
MIRVNRVYQKVLALANKEQRGYITPQEFNLFADMAQMDIFEQYFYDLEQMQRRSGNQDSYIDLADNIQEKINIFQRYDQDMGVSNNGMVILPSSGEDGGFYRIGTVRVHYISDNIGFREAEEITTSELNLFGSRNNASKRTKLFPHYHKNRTNNDSGLARITVYPHPNPEHGDRVKITYIVTPNKPNWTYITVANQGSALYNPSASDHQDFQLHISEENKLVTKILQYAGITIKDPQLVQAAAAQEITKEQQQKQ